MKIGIVGGSGRMGQMLVRQVRQTDGAILVGAVDRPDSPALGRDAGEVAGIGPIGTPITGDTEALFAAADAVIDFTAPAATRAHAGLAARNGTALIVGTTGLSDADQAVLDEAARRIPLVQAPNMAIGVVLLTAVIEQVARALDPSWDIEIVEMHHRHKVDAPSGTALGFGAAAAAGRGTTLKEAGILSREGHTGPRPAGKIGFAALRGGDVIGDHTVMFAGQGERIELTHKAASRDIYAVGAVRAAFWTRGRPAGRYSMRDVLGL